MSNPLPLIGVPACMREQEDGLRFHMAGEKYLDAVAGAIGGLPVIVPALGDEAQLMALVDRLDGLLLTGSPSDIEPQHYAGPPLAAEAIRDPARDATNLPLIRMAVEDALPILAICRGMQELNVALGGTLYPAVHEVTGRHDHREDMRLPIDQRYGPAHPVFLEEKGALAEILGSTEVTVNSLHGQGLDELSARAVVEAVAPDGQVEAIRIHDAPAFCLGVQWHPEWRWRENPVSRALLAAFGEAVRDHCRHRHEADSP